MFQCRETGIAGCFRIEPPNHRDERGSFTKLMHSPTFEELGLEHRFHEEYWTYSKKGVVRGMHFQVPPHDHIKLVTCLSGSALDVILDLRVGSPTYGKVESIELDSEKGTMVYIPTGLAHGFCADREDCLLLYRVTTVHNGESDRGVRWDTIGFEWPISEPILSARDQSLPAYADFHSPFVFS